MSARTSQDPCEAGETAEARDRYERRRADPSHGRPAEQRVRQGHGHVPIDPDEERRLEREPPYRGDVVGGATFDRGRSIENERPASVHPPLRGDEPERARKDEELRESLEDARRTAPTLPSGAPSARPPRHESERRPRERGTTEKIETRR